MKFLKDSIVLSLAMGSVLMLAACNNSKEADVNVDAAEVNADAAEKVDVVVVEKETIGNDVLAKQMAKQSIQAFTMATLASGNLTAEQKSCLQSIDDNLGVAETQKYLDDVYTTDELEAMNEAYSSDIMKKVNQYMQEQMVLMSGETVDNPMTPPTEAEMAEFQAMFQNDPRLQRLMEMNNNPDPQQNAFMESLKPLINGEFERCNIETTV